MLSRAGADAHDRARLRSLNARHLDKTHPITDRERAPTVEHGMLAEIHLAPVAHLQKAEATAWLLGQQHHLAERGVLVCLHVAACPADVVHQLASSSTERVAHRHEDIRMGSVLRRIPSDH